MSAVPYAPTPFTSPIVNPQIGGYGAPVPYISCSMYQFAPTAMDTTSLVPESSVVIALGGDAAAQTQALYDTIRRASAWADRICFGADPSGKGASLAATMSVESAYVKILNGEIRLICDYKPIVEVLGIDVGTYPANTTSIGNQISTLVRIGRRTIHVPVQGVLYNWPNNLPVLITPTMWGNGRLYAVWSYVNGYPQTVLTADTIEGATTVHVEATDGAGSLYGVYPGTQLTIYDGQYTETFAVQSLSGTTITTTTGLANAHTVPDAPDFLPVTQIPAEVQQAVIFLTTALIKTRGDNSLVLDELNPPERFQATSGDVIGDVEEAKRLLAPYKVHVKAKV